jgi:hypothetical protein
LQRTSEPNPEPPKKNPAAVELGRLGGLKGGKARKIEADEKSSASDQLPGRLAKMKPEPRKTKLKSN